MKDATHCPYCGFAITGEGVKLWDCRTYCRRCVEQVSPPLYELAATGRPLEETVPPEAVSAFRFVVSVGKWYLLAVALIFGLPIGLLVLRGNAPLSALLFVLLFFGGGGLVILTIKGLIGAATARSSLPRTVSVQDGRLSITRPDSQIEADLADCRFWPAGSNADPLCWFTGLHGGPVIKTPEAFFALGHDPEKADQWRAFMKLARLPTSRSVGCLGVLIMAVIGLIAGAAAGTGIGYILALATGNPLWTPGCGVLGAIEGPIAAVMVGFATHATNQTRIHFHPAVVAMGFFAVGVKGGLVGGWRSALLCGAINACVGASIALWCRARIRAREQERELADAFRR